MALTGTIIVTPEELRNKSVEMQQVVDSMKVGFQELAGIVSASGSYWIGTAGDMLRRQYAELNTEVEEVLQEFADYPAELCEMAGIYIGHNTGAQEKAEALPGNVLS